VKTDKRDSRKLARLLENNMLKKVYVLTEEDRADRELQGRAANYWSTGRCHEADQSKLLFYGIKTLFLIKGRAGQNDM
jgi:hypothetical protein